MYHSLVSSVYFWAVSIGIHRTNLHRPTSYVVYVVLVVVVVVCCCC